MRRTFAYIFAGILAFAAAGCSKEGAVEPVSYEDITVSGTSAGTKTYLSDESTGMVNWTSGNSLSAFSINVSSHSNNWLSMDGEPSGDAASFKGSIETGTTDFVLLYPYCDAATYSDGTISLANLPSTQGATAGSFANGTSLALAKGKKTPGTPECGNLEFENLCTILRFTLPENISFAKEITITAKSGSNLTGTVTIDCDSEEITGADINFVKLAGDFVGGNNYYASIVPGTYTGGFNFAIKTNDGNTYYRETTKTIEAEKGVIYALGTLSLALNPEDLSTSVSISHDIASNTLNGSTAKFSLTMNKSEYASVISKYKAVVTLKDASSNVYRTLTKEGTSITDAEMDPAEGKYYIPKGDYTYEAAITYTVNNGTKDVTRTLNYSGNVTSPQPSGFTLTGTTTGYTSYSCYKGTDGQSASTTNANNCDNATIYGIGAAYSSGLHSNVYNQCSNLLSISSTLDGSAASGNVGSQSWASHTIGGSISFDGVAGTVSSKTVYVTGLPFNKDNSNFYSTRSYWNISGDWKESNYLKMYKETSSFKNGFYIPSGSINATLSYKFKIYSGGYAKNTYKINIGTGNPLVTETHSAFASRQEYSGTANATLTSSASTMSCVDACKAITSGSGYSYTYYIGVTYR